MKLGGKNYICYVSPQGEEEAQNGYRNILNQYPAEEVSVDEAAALAVEMIKLWKTKLARHAAPKIDAGQKKVIVLDGYPYHKFETDKYDHEYWKKLIDDENKPLDLESFIVFHYLFGWREKYFQHFSNVLSGQSLGLSFDKVMLNLAFSFRGRFVGGLWFLRSVPNEALIQATEGDGKFVPVMDKETGKQLTDCLGRPAEAAIGPGDEMMPPMEEISNHNPDNIDKLIYNGVNAYCKNESKTKISQNWTMVRASFEIVDGDDRNEIRCYAFSGNSNSTRDYHTLPTKWWEENKSKNEFLFEDKEIYICNVDKSQLMQKIILKIFNISRPDIEDDLNEITICICLGEYHLYEALLRGVVFTEDDTSITSLYASRSDLEALEYETYGLEIKQELENFYDGIKRIVCSIIKRDNLDESYYKNHIQNNMIRRACKENQKFEPNVDALNNLTGIGEETKKKLIKILEKKLKELEEQLRKSATKYLDEFRKKIERCKCGEDNVLHLLLEKYMAKVKIFSLVPVKFIAMDGKSLDTGKPFCEACSLKVRFYNLIPYFLYELGFNLKEEEHAELMKKLFK